MPGVHLLDRHIGSDWPDLSTHERLLAFESVPYSERIAASSTYEALRVGATHDPDAPALRFLRNADPAEEPVTISYGQFFGRVTQTANALTSLGVGPKDVVSIALPLLPQAYFTLFGAEAAGIVNPVNPLLEPHQLLEILRAAGTTVLVTLGPMPGADIWEKVQRIRRNLPSLRAILVVGGGAVAGAPGSGPAEHDFDAIVGAQPSDRLISGRTIAPDDLAAYFHTGGTTGLPKLVRHTHANQVYQAWAAALTLRMRPGQTILCGLPLFHVGGALTQGLSILSTGCTAVVVSPSGWRLPAALRNVWKLVERYQPETFGGVPTVLGAALTAPIDGADLSSLRRATGGGAAIPVAVGRAYTERFKLPVFEIYGMTETSSMLTTAYPDRPIRLGSAGHPLPYSRVRVLRLGPGGRREGDAAINEIGVVVMAGPGVFSGYLSETHNDGAFAEPGWVDSGDLGRLDEDGYLWLTGRAKDLVIRGGHNIDPQSIEALLFEHPAVAIAAVVGQPDAYAGELPVAYVQPKPGAAVDPDALIAHVRERAPERAAVPVAVYVHETIPLTAVGKVFKPALRWDAARRVVEQKLADLNHPGLTVEVGAHPKHGSLITVAFSGVAAAEQEPLAKQVHERLDPLAMQHEIAWR